LSSHLLDRLTSALADRYRIERRLGGGGMAKVFLAEDLRHHRLVAIKVLKPEVALAIGHARFLREIATLSSLTHPHILPLLESGIVEGLPIYVMPYVEGEPLRARLDREGELPLEDVTRITSEVADALAYAHGRGVVHRDIKPENILLEQGRAVVADFGIARAASPGTGRLTATGVVVGTPAYLSPEQASGGRELDGRSDLYSLACVVHEMLTGQPPFHGMRPESLIYQHMRVTPRPVTELRPTLPEAVGATIERALAKLPADRHSTVAEFASELRAGASEHRTPVPAEVPAPARDPVRPGSSRAWVSGLVIVSVCLLMTGLAAWRHWWPFAEGSVRASTPERRDWVLVAEFDGPADDPELAHSVRHLVVSAIDQSANAAVLPAEQVALGLERAGRPDSLPVKPELARELAYRAGIRTVLDGEIVRLGSRYSVTLRLIDVEADRELLTLHDVARSEADLMRVLRRLGGRLQTRFDRQADLVRRTALGRSRSWPVATSSFEAYRRFAEGSVLWDRGDSRGALRLDREAVAVDPTFGSAWAAMGWCWFRLGRVDSAQASIREALRHPRSLTPAYRLYLDGVLAWWGGDPATAKEVFSRVARAYPDAFETGFALGNWSTIALSEGRYDEALALLDRMGQGAFEVTPVVWKLRAGMLIALGRLLEARAAIAHLQDDARLEMEFTLALAECRWASAESLAVAAAKSSGSDAGGQPWQLAAVRGELRRADALLLQAERSAYEARAVTRARYARARVLLSQMYGWPAPTPGPWLEADTTVSALITRGYLAVAAGDTTRARRLLTELRSRRTVRLGAHGAATEFLEACIAARAERWDEVIARIARPARDGSDVMVMRNDPISDRIGTAPERWMVASAHERLGHPDSAIVFYERMLGPGSPQHDLVGLTHPFVHQRLAVLRARKGELAEAERHLAVLERDVTRPDPEVRHLIDQARDAVGEARGGATRAALVR